MEFKLIRIKDLHFSYFEKRGLFSKPTRKNILNNFSLEIPESCLFGLIGENGSGKTTLTKILMGVFKPEQGSVTIDYFGDPYNGKNNWKESIGIISGATSKIFNSMFLFEQVKYFEILYAKFCIDSFNNYIDFFNIRHILNKRAASISFGERIKYEIALTLSYFPKILILDEPTVGLDTIAIQQVREILTNYVQQYKACGILTSHNLKDINEMTNFFGYLKNGNIINFFNKNEMSLSEIEKKYVELYS
ncbi:ATP-binding cassette domain-containing protein [Silvanigrella paludirubra]|uniref:ATP-binding cassette domain-containing protein n=1 Tax=Silvanigrella paludirubra TaxID=2499159 RepID=A0A6N6VQJ6_9BACT|nr:ATP-binding cassette domain-containing protein [Silvanigrella paludirubra]